MTETLCFSLSAVTENTLLSFVTLTVYVATPSLIVFSTASLKLTTTASGIFLANGLKVPLSLNLVKSALITTFLPYSTVEGVAEVSITTTLLIFEASGLVLLPHQL